jgi:hypothetical protein
MFSLAYADRAISTSSEMNILCVDWGMLANPSALPNPLLYGESVKSTMMVGEKTADLLAALYNKEIVRDFSDVHIIGSSLGSHIAGVAGHKLQTQWGLPSKLGRITGTATTSHNSSQRGKRFITLYNATFPSVQLWTLPGYFTEDRRLSRKSLTKRMLSLLK